MTRRRLYPDDRKAQILTAALILASKTGGWGKLTRIAVANEAKCSEALVSKHFGTMQNFKRDVMRAAISSKRLPVIAQGLMVGDKHARNAPDELKTQAIKSLQE